MLERSAVLYWSVVYWSVVLCCTGACCSAGILSLKGNPLHDELAMVLSSMQHEQMSITSLDLRKTKMTDQGAEWLAAGLSSCCHLERLLLSDNQITEASGLLLMAAAEDHLALHHLSVEGNQV